MSAALAARAAPPVNRNGFHVKPYVYRGTGFDTLTPELGDAFDDLCPCGETMAGYRRHLRSGEQPCAGSRAAVNGYHAERRRPCGTPAGYRRHLRSGEQPCQACRDAESGRARAARPTEGSAVHADRGDGGPRCGAFSPYAVGGAEVTCRRCLKLTGKEPAQ